MRQPLSLAAVLLAATVLAPAPAAAQRAYWAESSFHAGQRVRLKDVTNDVVTGAVLAVHDDSIAIARDGGGDTTYSFARIVSVDSGAGVRRHLRKWMVRGTLGGAGIGFGMAVAGNEDHPCKGEDVCLTNNAGSSAWQYAAVGGAIGLVAGALNGVRRTEDWNEVAPLPPVQPIRVGDSPER
jgi:hypothetical protein